MRLEGFWLRISCSLWFPSLSLWLSNSRRLFSASSPDSGTWIPPPAQRSQLQPFAGAFSHWHSIWGHQTVSFMAGLWKFIRATSPNEWMDAKILSVVHVGAFQILLFRQALAQCCLSLHSIASVTVGYASFDKHGAVCHNPWYSYSFLYSVNNCSRKFSRLE